MVCLSCLHLLQIKERTYHLKWQFSTQFSEYILCCNMLYLSPANFLYMAKTVALKSLNEMQQTASMRLTIIPHDITVIYATYFQMYYYLMQ